MDKEDKKKEQDDLKGILSEYADPALIDKEKDAWESAAVEKYIKFQKTFDKK